MNLTTRRVTGSWSSVALVSSFVLGMLFHRNASSLSKFKLGSFLRKFESKNKSLTNGKKSKVNSQAQAATKCKLDQEFDVNILFMN